jgi:DNA repair protein RecN (Recombination protein N)
MLTVLRVRRLAVIDALDLELGPGLNVVTGETGAGKSILIGALKLVLGGRANADVVRAGAEEAEVEAIFDVSGSEALRARLRDLLDRDEDELIIRRVVPVQGRSRAYVNGTLATAGQLAQLTEGLVDICSQHEHHTLASASSHLLYLDAFAGLAAARTEVAAAWRAWQQVDRALREVADRARDRSEREAVLRYQLDEIEAVSPTEDELTHLEADRSRLAHAGRLAEVTTSVEHTLYARDEAVCDQLGRLAQRLGQVRHLDPRLESLAERLDAAHTDLEDLARDLGAYARGVVHDPDRLRLIDDRLVAIRRLERRYGGTLPAVLAHLEQARRELRGLEHIDGEIEQLTASRDLAVQEVMTHARVLSAQRREAARHLGAAITRELWDLGMGEAEVVVDVASLEGRGGLQVDGTSVSAQGMDHVEFLIAPNRGDPPKPLQRIASGGELSRSLLAIKRVLSREGPSGLYVFDEVDTGVGGAIAEVIGRKLHDVASYHQVLCITHQPQIAVYGDRHFHVTKVREGDRTASRLTRLDETGRVEEIARMMGGVDITGVTRSAAAELLAQARAVRGEPESQPGRHP